MNSQFSKKGLIALSAGVFALGSFIAHPIAQAAGNGMTWEQKSHDDVLGVDYVNCSGCNAYSGETSCSSQLPILCLKKEGLPNPGVYVPATSPGVMQPIYYYGWTGGRIELTCPVSGDALKGIADANDICEFQFGSGYKMAEFHDGNGGWGWYAYGNIDDSSRFWVTINDQSSNCWGRGTGVSSARTDAQISELLDCGEPQNQGACVVSFENHSDSCYQRHFQGEDACKKIIGNSIFTVPDEKVTNAVWYDNQNCADLGVKLLATGVDLTATKNGAGVDLTLTTTAEPDTAALDILRGDKLENGGTAINTVCSFPSGGSPYTCTDTVVGDNYRVLETEYDGDLIVYDEVKPKKK